MFRITPQCAETDTLNTVELSRVVTHFSQNVIGFVPPEEGQWMCVDLSASTS